MNVNEASTIFGLPSWLIRVTFYGNDSYTMEWQPFQPKHCMTYIFPYYEIERQRCINNLWSCVFGSQGIASIFELITELLSAFIGKHPTYKRENTDSKIINMANSKRYKKRLFAAEYVILVRYYYQTAKARALFESTDGPAGRPAEKTPNSVRLGDLNQTVPGLTVRV